LYPSTNTIGVKPGGLHGLACDTLLAIRCGNLQIKSHWLDAGIAVRIILNRY